MIPLLLSTLLALAPAGAPATAEPTAGAAAQTPAPALAPVEPAAEPAPAAPPDAGLEPLGWRWEPSPVPAPEPPSPAPAPPAAAFLSPLLPPEPEAPPPEGWLDEGHAYVSDRLLKAIERVDRFFGDNREVDVPRNDSWVRWRNDVRFSDRGTLAFKTSARAEIRIPSLDERLERLRITVTGGTTDALDRLLPGDPSTPDAPNRASAGLRLALFDTLLTHSDVSAGLLFSLPVGWYARLRLRHNQPVGDLFVARFAASGFWQTPTGWGTREDVDLERQLAPQVLLRLANTATITEVSRGWEWGSELSLLTVLGDETALFAGLGPSGATALGPSVEIWRVHAKVRRDLWRRWLFLEVEPGTEWTRPVGGGRVRERYVILRLEVQFDAEASRRASPVAHRRFGASGG